MATEKKEKVVGAELCPGKFYAVTVSEAKQMKDMNRAQRRAWMNANHHRRVLKSAVKPFTEEEKKEILK